MKVTIDYTRCDGQLLCVTRAPDVFAIRDDDLAQVTQANPPVDLHELVRAAALLCPKGAIQIES